MTKKCIKICLIDVQNDFADPKGSLFVPSADQDMQRLTHLVNRTINKVDDFLVSLDSHHLCHVANPPYWRDSNGDPPKPFTQITDLDMEKGTWTTRIPSLYKKTLTYLKDLKAAGRYPHTIWPPHCLIGSWGHGVYPELFNALLKWEEEFAVVNYVTKGSNLFREHFSAVQAGVVDPNDPSTQINVGLIQAIEAGDEVALAGIAGSHCVAETTRDLVNNFSNPDTIKKLVLLTDCMSPVPGYEKLQADFIKEMVARGMRTSTSEDYLK